MIEESCVIASVGLGLHYLGLTIASISPVILDLQLSFFMPQFSHLQKGDNNSISQACYKY